MSIELSEQEQLRRQSLAALRELGIDPYPAARYEVTATAREIAENFDPAKNNFQGIRIAGRIMSRRIMGSASFFELQDHTGRIQVYIRRDDICPEGDPTLYNTVFKKLLDIGDIVGVEGFAFRTNTGELSVHCQKLTLLSKSLRPLPVVKEKDGQTFDAFTDPEIRYRQRYVDLIVNPHVREVFIKRSKIISTMREYFNQFGYVEVETPILQPIPGGAAARPFITHHNALDIDQYLRIASELYLKKLIVGGFDGVYEFGKNFRNEGMDRTHNPEFTVMEIYVAYKDYLWMMEFTERMLERVALAVNGTTELMGDEEARFIIGAAYFDRGCTACFGCVGRYGKTYGMCTGHPFENIGGEPIGCIGVQTPCIGCSECERCLGLRSIDREFVAFFDNDVVIGRLVAPYR